ncbi:MAG: Uma2 family endonuclease [Vulcanimicrobiaceae bacterium]
MREPIIPQLAEREFLSWEAAQDGKFELHRGFVMAFAGGTIDHDTIAFNLRACLDRLFPAPCRTFGADVKVRVSADTFSYADAGVVREAVAGDATVIERARIVAEVLSRSTRSYDLIEKRAAYRSMPSLTAYVVVQAEMRRVEVDVRAQDGSWRTETYDDGEAFVEGRVIPLDAIYARSSLEDATGT